MKKEKENSTDSNGLYGKIEELMGIDLRSLGVFRIGVGGLILLDLVIRASSLVAHYTDLGVAPRSLVVAYGEQPWFLSFHMLSGDIWLQVLLFVFAGISAIGLMLGFYSRIFCLLCWILTLSLHVRNPFVNNLGDWLLVDLLFWGMFLPLGARFSVDAVRRPSDQILPKHVLSIASLGILLQIGFMYFFSVQHKFTPAWRVDGTAVEMALHLDRIVSAVGLHLLNLPDSWLRFMTFATLHLERWGPVLVFLPFFTGPVRTVVAICFMGFHLMLAIFFEIGVFPYLCIIAWILYLPAWYWDNLLARATGIRQWVYMQGEKLALLIKARTAGKEKVLRIMPTALESVIGALLLFAMLSSAMLYGGIMGEGYYDSLYRHMEPVVNTFNLKQRWDMFSPQPPNNDGWFVVAAYTKEGKVENVLHPGHEVTWERPAVISRTYQNQRWRKYLEWVMSRRGPYADSFAAYGAWLYRSQETAIHSRIEYVSIYLMEELTLSDLTPSSISRIEVGRGY